jgi:hypothetical protein
MWCVFKGETLEDCSNTHDPPLRLAEIRTEKSHWDLLWVHWLTNLAYSETLGSTAVIINVSLWTSPEDFQSIKNFCYPKSLKGEIYVWELSDTSAYIYPIPWHALFRGTNLWIRHGVMHCTLSFTSYSYSQMTALRRHLWRTVETKYSYEWKSTKYFVENEVLTGIVMKSSVFWDITPYILLKVKRRFGGTCRLHLQGWRVSQTRNCNRFVASAVAQVDLLKQGGGGDFFVFVSFSVTASEWDSLQGITGLLNWYWSKRGLGEQFILWLNDLPFGSVTLREFLFISEYTNMFFRVVEMRLLSIRAEDTTVWTSVLPQTLATEELVNWNGMKRSWPTQGNILTLGDVGDPRRPIQDIRCPGRNSNRGPPERKSRALPLHIFAHCCYWYY